MKLRRQLKQIASPKRMADVLGVSYQTARIILSQGSNKHKKAIVEDLIWCLEEYLHTLKEANKIL